VIDLKDAVDKYIQYLKLEREEPTGNYLQRLIQHHLSIVPYETFSKFHYFQQYGQAIPPFEVFVQNMIDKNWGGTCFTLNINFAKLLEKLGFSCSLVRVNPGHIAIMVLVGERKFYVDVGYGSPIIKPVELETKPQHVLHGFGEEIIFTRKTDTCFEIDRRSFGKTFVKKTIEWTPLSEHELIQDIKESYYDHPSNKTMRRVTAVHFNGSECYYLRDLSLKIINYRNIREIQMRDYDKWKQTIQAIYQIDEDTLEQTIVFLQKRDVYLF